MVDILPGCILFMFPQSLKDVFKAGFRKAGAVLIGWGSSRYALILARH